MGPMQRLNYIHIPIGTSDFSANCMSFLHFPHSELCLMVLFSLQLGWHQGLISTSIRSLLVSSLCFEIPSQTISFSRSISYYGILWVEYLASMDEGEWQDEWQIPQGPVCWWLYAFWCPLIALFLKFLSQPLRHHMPPGSRSRFPKSRIEIYIWLCGSSISWSLSSKLTILHAQNQQQFSNPTYHLLQWLPTLRGKSAAPCNFFWNQTCYLVSKIVGVEMFNLVYIWSRVLTYSLVCHIVTHELSSFLPSSYSSSRLPQQLVMR